MRTVTVCRVGRVDVMVVLKIHRPERYSGWISGSSTVTKRTLQAETVNSEKPVGGKHSPASNPEAGQTDSGGKRNYVLKFPGIVVSADRGEEVRVCSEISRNNGNVWDFRHIR